MSFHEAKALLYIDPHTKGGLLKRLNQIETLLKPDYDTLIVNNRSDPRFRQKPPPGSLCYFNSYTLGRYPLNLHRDFLILGDFYSPFWLENLERNRLNLDISILLLGLERADLILTANQHQSNLLSCIATSKKTLIQPFYAETTQKYLPAQARNPLAYASQRGEDPELTSPSQTIAWVGGGWQWMDLTAWKTALPDLQRNWPDFIFNTIGADLANYAPHADYRLAIANLRISVVLHKRGLESLYSHRTRYFELMEAGIPLICTQDGDLADQIQTLYPWLVLKDNSPERLMQAIDITLQKPWPLDYTGILQNYQFDRQKKSLLQALRLTPKSRTGWNPRLRWEVLKQVALKKIGALNG